MKNLPEQAPGLNDLNLTYFQNIMSINVLQYGMFALLLLTFLAGVGCRPKLGGDGRPLAVVVSGDTAGWIVPCGCATNQSGGLPRRGAYIERLRREASVVVFDAGGAPAGNSPYDRTKFEAILVGEMLMDIAAHNVGAAEAQLGADELRRLAAIKNAPLISANVLDAADRPVAEQLRIVEAAGRRLAVVGVLSRRYATGQIHVKPPRQAILETLRQAAGRYDWLIVLAYLPEEELRELAESLPEADAIVGGPTGQPVPPRRIGPVFLTSAANKGKFLARLDVPHSDSSGGWTGSIVELDEGYADDPHQTANIEEFRRELARRDFTPEQTSLADPLPANLPKNFAVAGTDACQKCHEDDCSLWRKSKHTLAWNSLKAKDARFDPDCQRCHTTGYGLPGGFASVGSGGRLTDVGCENCHGPSQAHVKDPTVLTAYYAQAKDRCVSCHDRENSPKFNYSKYWAQISHGKAAEPQDAGAVENEKGN
jgi:nucleotide-binding universal stress UspA family protein